MRIIRIPATKFNQKSHSAIAILTSQQNVKIVVTKRGVDYFEIVMCKKRGR